MKKTASLLLLTTALISGKAFAQHNCATDELHKKYIQEDPSLAEKERQFNESIRRTLSHLDVNTLHRTTTSITDTNQIIDIPVAVHIMHSYGTDYITDESVYALIARMNNTYSLNYDTSSIIAPFKKYVGKANIRFHLATKDPNGNPTRGITRRFTYLTMGGDNQVKMDQWSPMNYYNIWFENVIGMGVAGGTVLAYAQFPSDFDARSFYDGVICAAPFIGDGSTIEHETGHYFSLYHTWNSSGAACGTAGACGDDEVDDTPPTIGHPSGCPLYDTICATNYFKLYSDIHGNDSLVNYPDTTNAQNMMDYACETMFSKGQVVRMRNLLLKSDVGKRDSLYTPSNLANTGALDAIPDLTPVSDFFASNSNKVQYFTCPGTTLKFTNKTWRDTVTSIVWTFSNGATTPTTTLTNPSFSSYVNNAFTDGGWVNIVMASTGNHSGTSVDTFNHSVYVADAVATPAQNVMAEFSTDGDFNKWPTFNYYNNEFKWQHAGVGFYDNHSMMYTGFDSRVNPTLGTYPNTGTPKGDFDDFFSIPVDLSGFASGNCNMNFFTSGASRSSISLDINDTMIISYSIDGAKTWTTLTTLGKGDLLNKGASSTAYVPTTTSDWVGRTVAIPTAARKPYVVFRFRYLPGVDHNGYLVSTGNNFYMDRLNFSPFPAGVNDVKMGNLDVAVVPNPTNSNAYVVVKDADNTIAHVIVSDIAGKVIYTTQQQISGNEAHIEIPQSALQTAGIYMVQTTTGNQTKTQKLVVY